MLLTGAIFQPRAFLRYRSMIAQTNRLPNFNDGPWDLPSDVKKNALVKYSGHISDYDASVLLSYYDNEWNSTDQVPQRLVGANALDRFGFIDPTLGGESTRISLIASISSQQMQAGLYASRYRLNLFNNFTYFLDDPVNGDQVEQEDRRWVYGGQGNYTFELSDTNS